MATAIGWRNRAARFIGTRAARFWTKLTRLEASQQQFQRIHVLGGNRIAGGIRQATSSTIWWTNWASRVIAEVPWDRRPQPCATTPISAFRGRTRLHKHLFPELQVHRQKKRRRIRPRYVRCQVLRVEPREVHDAGLGCKANECTLRDFGNPQSLNLYSYVQKQSNHGR